MKYNLACGLEVHCQLAAPHKLFSVARSTFAERPNSRVAFFDAALPGSQPRLNAYAVLLAVKAAIGLGCGVSRRSTFERKHYFYPDQPSGYQITQHYNPLARKGQVKLFAGEGVDQTSYIGISHVQLEQDTGKTIYTPEGTLVDLNRTGTALIEIVTTPTITTPAAAGATLGKIRAILRAVGASEANMEAGQMRCDVNVSISAEEAGLGKRNEIKNLASIRSVTDAVAAEYAYQSSVLASGQRLVSETRGYDVQKGTTFPLRKKEGDVDYRYMPEPDLPPVLVHEDLVSKCQEQQPELPDETFQRLTSDPHGLSAIDAKALMSNSQKLKYYDEVVRSVPETMKSAGNWIIHELSGRLGLVGLDFASCPVDTARMADLLRETANQTISGSSGKILLQRMLDGDSRSIKELSVELGMRTTRPSDDHMRELCRALLQEYPKQADELRNGKMSLLKYFVGRAMQKQKGNLNSLEFERVLREVCLPRSE